MIASDCIGLPTERTDEMLAHAQAERLATRLAGRMGFWYRIGHSHIRAICATSEDEARQVILARHAHARGQRLELSPMHP